MKQDGTGWIDVDMWTERCRCVHTCVVRVIDLSSILMSPSDLLGLLSVLMISVIGEPTGN